MAQNYQINFTFTFPEVIFIVPAILLGILLLILFRSFPRYGINSFAAIIYNYVFATISGFCLYKGSDALEIIRQEPRFLYAIPLGSLFITVFYLISKTTQSSGISVASVANRMSVIMPVLFSVLVLHQQLHWYMIIGICFALVSVYLTSAKNDHKQGSLLFPVLLFIGSGIIDTSLNAANALFIHNNDESALFTMLIFLSAFVFGSLVVAIGSLTGKLNGKEFFLPKNLLAGLCLGVPNYFSIYLIFLSLDTKLLSSAQLFPVMNVANVALAALVAAFLFKEKLSLMNIAGVVFAILSIILLAI